MQGDTNGPNVAHHCQWCPGRPRKLGESLTRPTHRLAMHIGLRCTLSFIANSEQRSCLVTMCHAKHAAFENLRSFHISMQHSIIPRWMTCRMICTWMFHELVCACMDLYKILMQYGKCSHGIVVRLEDGNRSSQGSNPDKVAGLFSGQI